ncbi:hypothetical protein ABK040_002469 [Willaertia magna]
MAKFKSTIIVASLFFLATIGLNYFIYFQLSKHEHEAKEEASACKKHLVFTQKEVEVFKNKILDLESQLQQEKLKKTNNEEEKEDIKIVRKQLDLWQHPRISSETPYLSTKVIEPRPINKFPEFKEHLYRTGELEISKKVQDYNTILKYNSGITRDVDTLLRLGYRDNSGKLINNQTALEERIKELKYSERISEFEIMYRYTWSHNGQLQLSDHVYLEPMWKIQVKCPKDNQELEINEWTNYELPNDSFSDYNPKLHGIPNKEKRKRKTLGVYIALTEVRNDGILYKEDNPYRISLFDSINNWKNMFIKKYNYPIVIFHFGNMTERIRNKFIEQVKDVKDCKMYFVQINPDEFSESKFTKQPWVAQETEHNRHNKRYYDMSKFLGHDLYKHPIMDNFIYYFRLDDDATFLNPVNYDPFKFMYLNNLLIGYSMLGMPESGDPTRPWTHGFIEKTWTYCLKQGILPPEEIRINGNFGTADTIHAGPFELGKISVYNNPAYEHFLESVNIWEGMATWGWREQFVKTIWVKLYIPRFSTHWFCDFSTHHYVPFAQRCYVDCI